MSNKLFNNLLLFSLLGCAMWFFGNLYEGIVMGPNMLGNSIQQMHYWQNYFSLTNPIFYYVPITQAAALVLVVLYFMTPKHKSELKRRLKLANIFQVPALLLSVYIITQINLKLFFGDLEKYAADISSLALLWNALNIFRVCLLGMAMVFIFKAYVQTQDDKQSRERSL